MCSSECMCCTALLQSLRGRCTSASAVVQQTLNNRFAVFTAVHMCYSIQDVEGISKICTSMQPIASIRALTVDSSNANNVRLVNLKLKTMTDVLTTEFIVLLNSNGQVVAAPNDPQKLLVGTQWNPGYVVSSTLATGRR
jgi:C4-dicarboxylate-specific signal transduction histidine kinase